MNNAHINLNEFTHPSRVLKQVDSLTRSSIFEKITIIALGAEGLKEHEKVSENVDLHRLRLLTRELPSSAIFQVAKYLEFFIRTIAALSRTRPEVVNAHALGALPIALFFKILFGSLVVYDAHELETEQVGGTTLRKAISKRLERVLITRVDMMLVVSESIADWYVQEYGIKRPTVVLNAPRRRDLESYDHFRDQLDIRDDQIILLYQGGLAAGRGVDLMLEAFKHREDDRIVAVFMGYGDLEQEVRKVALSHPNVFFFPAVSPQVVLEYTMSADIGIALIQNTCLSYEFCMPNKLFEYAMAGLPVLVSNVKDMSTAVLENEMGSVTDDFTASGINRAIDSILDRDLATMSANAYRMACENSWELQEQRMISSYSDLLRPPPQSGQVGSGSSR